MLFKSDVYAVSKHLMKSSQKGENVDLAKIMNFSKSEKWNKKGARCAYSIQFFAGGAVITNPPLNQNKTEGDLVNFSCEGEVNLSSQVFRNMSTDENFLKMCQEGTILRRCVKS